MWYRDGKVHFPIDVQGHENSANHVVPRNGGSRLHYLPVIQVLFQGLKHLIRDLHLFRHIICEYQCC